VLRARGLVKTYGSGNETVRALDGVDIDLMSGGITMVVGPSGCGKTTLISVLAATLDADAGTIEAFEQPLHTMDSEAKTAFRRRNIGFVFQQYNLLPGLSAEENVEIPDSRRRPGVEPPARRPERCSSASASATS
jgi:putative ABC transport system ATP-binding protein